MRKNQIVDDRLQKAGRVFRGVRAIFDLDRLAHRNRVRQRAVLARVARDVHEVLVGHRIVDAASSVSGKIISSVQLGNVRNICAAGHPVRLLIRLNIGVGTQGEHKDAGE